MGSINTFTEQHLLTDFLTTIDRYNWYDYWFGLYYKCSQNKLLWMENINASLISNKLPMPTNPLKACGMVMKG